MIGPILLLILVSALLVVAMTRLGALDHPVARSSHVTPTPKGGGVGIVAAFLLGLWLLGPHDGAALGLALAAALLAAVAYLDDLRDWPFAVKLAAQLAAAALAAATGARLGVVALPVAGAVDLGWLGVPVTMAWLVFATNAVNFIDGLNGLASGCVGLACLVLAAVAHGAGERLVWAGALSLAAGIAGFLPFNFPRARIFMGDVGSQVCGFVSAALGVMLAAGGPAAQGGAGAFWPWLSPGPYSVLLLPLLLFGIYADVVFTLIRRARAGERLTQAHRGHLYQLAQQSGVGAPVVSLIYWGMVGWGGLVYAACAGAVGLWRLVVLLLVLPPWVGWLGFVRGRVRKEKNVLF